jgi:hypothetical protein
MEARWLNNKERTAKEFCGFFAEALSSPKAKWSVQLQVHPFSAMPQKPLPKVKSNFEL